MKEVWENIKQKISGKGKVKSEASDMEKNRKISNKAKRKKRIRNIIGYTILGVIALVIICGGLFLLYIASTAPKFNPDQLYSKESSVLYDKNKKEFAKLGTEKRENVTFDELPQVLVDAIVATEDSRFYQHSGFDLPRFLKASGGQLLGHSDAGGASTLTMQVVKNTFTSTDQTIVRKFTDIYMSIFVLEKNYSKEEIMEFYVNAPYLGSGAYGVQQAARVYFNKNVSDLNLVEAATIAGLFQAPGAYDPYVYPEKAENRRNTVLSLMKRHGYITKEQEEIARKISVSSTLAGKHGTNYQVSEYQGYIDVVVQEIIDETGYNPYDTPMEVYTCLDTDKQAQINKLMDGTNYTWEDDRVQAGFTVQDINTGAVIAIGNGRGTGGERNFSYATMIKRQPGSTAKPLFDFGPGIEYLNWSTGQIFADEPTTYGDGKTPINNWDNKYMGDITVRTSIAQSRNIPSLKAFQTVSASDNGKGNKKIIDFVEGLGITPEVENGRIHEAHSIGGFNGMSPMEMGAAYSAFGNGGYYIKPHTVDYIVYREDNRQEDFNHEKTKAMKDSTAYMITSCLQSAAQGISAGASVPGVNVAAKTGTTNLDQDTIRKWGLPGSAHLDIWMVGYDPEYAIAMWYGYEKLSKTDYLGSSSSNYRNRLFKAVGNIVWKKNGQNFKMPSSVVAVEIEKGSNPPKLPSESTPADQRITELFVKGTEPTDTSVKYYGLQNVGNLKGSYDKASKKVSLQWDAITTSIVDETLGSITYEIYLDGKSIGSTQNNYFDYKYSGNSKSLTFTVKTTFENDNSQQSSGSTVTVKTADDYKCLPNNMMSSFSVGDTLPLNGALFTIDDTSESDFTVKWKLLSANNTEVAKGVYPGTGPTLSSAGSYKFYYICVYENHEYQSNPISITVN